MNNSSRIQATCEEYKYKEGKLIMGIDSFKYIHFFWHNSTEFPCRIVKMINDDNAGFDKDEHLFVTVHKKVYDSISGYSNVQYIDATYKEYASIVNDYALKCKWIFFHSIYFGLLGRIKLNSKSRKKIIWRTWGHDTGRNYNTNSVIRNVYNWIIDIPWRYEVRSFKYVAIANEVDRTEIRKRFKANNLFILPYPVQRSITPVVVNDERKDNTISILVGHSGYSNDNHIRMIERLRKYDKELIRMYFVLSYGDETYIKFLKDKIHQLCPENSVIIDKYMDANEYVKFLSQMDIAIFDGLRSYALGNIGLLLSMRKKIYLNPNGVIAETFSRCGIPYSSSEVIGTVSLEKLADPPIYSSGQYPIEPHGYLWGVNQWHELLKELT